MRTTLFNDERVDDALAKWRTGQPAAPSVVDIVTALKFPLIFLFLAILYHLVVYYGGGKLQ